MKRAWRRRASFITSGISLVASPGKASKKRTKAPRQRGIVTTGRGESSSSETLSATRSGVSITPEKEAAASGSSSLSFSIGLQMPSGQTAETSMPLTPDLRRSASVPIV